MTVQQAVYIVLSTDAALAALVDGRIYPDVPADNTPLPYVVYWATDNNPNPTLNGRSTLNKYTMQVECLATKLTDITAIQAAVDDALDQYRDDDIKGSFAQGSETNPEDEGYHGTQQFSVWLQR